MLLFLFARGNAQITNCWPQYLVSYYERFGFKNAGASKAEYGGGGWYNMVRPSSI